MDLDARLLEILACPVDKGSLLYFADEDSLYNPRLRLRYRIDDGIPVMLSEEAEHLDETEHQRLIAQAEASAETSEVTATDHPEADSDPGSCGDAETSGDPGSSGDAETSGDGGSCGDAETSGDPGSCGDAECSGDGGVVGESKHGDDSPEPSASRSPVAIPGTEE